MNLTVFTAGDDIFKNCEYIKGYAFKMVATRGKSVQFQLVQDFVALRSKSTRKTATFAQLQDKSVNSTVLNASYHMCAS